MFILILPICFTLIFLSLGVFTKPATKKELLVISVLAFSGITVAVTELTSALYKLNFTSILFCWCVVALGNLIYLYLNKQQAIAIGTRILPNAANTIKSLTIRDKILTGSTFIILLLIFIQGILYPPNSWDSMTYHMARITSWVSHGSVAHYPTAIIRQLYQPPFAEFMMMHFGLLSGTDQFSNALQFLFLLFSMVSILLVVDFWALDKRYKVIAMVLAVTIPEVALQASSTQNDIVVSFFVITAFYFALKAIKHGTLFNFLFLGIAVGLATLTKGTAYLYLAPVILFFAIRLLIVFIKTLNYKLIGYALITLCFFIAVNAGHYYRNYKFSHNVLGIDQEESRSYSNQKMSFKLFCSSVVKNTGLHLNFMFVDGIANASDSAIIAVHKAAGMDVNAPGINYKNTKFKTQLPTNNADSAPDMLYLLLMLSAFAVLLSQSLKRTKEFVNPLLLISILQFVLFCLYLKWQPWHSRLHTPLFLLTVPLLCYAFSISGLLKKVFYIITPVLFVYVLITVLHNDNNPYTGSMFANRYQKYFRGNPDAYTEYDGIDKLIARANYINIGLKLGVDDWEYPLFNTCFTKNINPVYIQVTNATKTLPQSNTAVDCIVATNFNKPFIAYNGRFFYNQNPNNKILYLYK